MRVDEPCLPLFRLGRGFRADELQARLAKLPGCASSGPASEEEAIADPSWHHYFSEALIARETPGLPQPGGSFERAREAIAAYQFSDPNTVEAYFDPTAPLQGRPMVLQIKVLGVFMLCGVVVRAVRTEQTAQRTVWGFRYDTLVGHVEAGAEWFLLSKDHSTGRVQFRIQATWREGTLPSWWMRIGFQLFTAPYQRAWHRDAYLRLRKLLGAEDLPPLPHRRAMIQQWRPVVPALHEVET